MTFVFDYFAQDSQRRGHLPNPPGPSPCLFEIFDPVVLSIPPKESSSCRREARGSVDHMHASIRLALIHISKGSKLPSARDQQRLTSHKINAVDDDSDEDARQAEPFILHRFDGLFRLVEDLIALDKL